MAADLGVHPVLRSTGLAAAVTVPISAGLLIDTGGYFAALDAYREGDFRPLLTSMAEASLRAVANARQLIVDLDLEGAGGPRSARRVCRSSGQTRRRMTGECRAAGSRARAQREAVA